MNSKHVALLLLGATASYVALAVSGGPRPWFGGHALLRDAVPPAIAEESGTRLKAKFTLGSDGSKLFDPEVMYDSSLDVDCTFRLAKDGVLRCLPTVPLKSFDAWAALYFHDTNCTQPFAAVPDSAFDCNQVAPKYAFHPTLPQLCVPTNDDLKLRVFSVGATTTPVGQTYAHNGLGQCLPGGPAQGALTYELTEVAPSAFVAATATTDQ